MYARRLLRQQGKGDAVVTYFGGCSGNYKITITPSRLPLTTTMTPARAETTRRALVTPRPPTKPARAATIDRTLEVSSTKATGRRSRSLRMPSRAALELARDAADRAQNRICPVRVGFIERTDETNEVPMAELLRGGQGGEVRLKLLLSMLWMAGNPPHDTTYPARVWATLLDLPQPESNGARRVTAAISWLENRGLLRTDRTPGMPATAFLLDERCNGEPYRPPGEIWQERKESGEPMDQSDYWVRLPPEFWTKGWITILDGPAIAMLLALSAEAGRYKRITDLWFSEKQGRRRFDLSIDTRNDGLRELERRWLVSSRKQSISRSSFDYRKVRKTYTLRLAQLKAGPERHVLDTDAYAADLGARATDELIAGFTTIDGLSSPNQPLTRAAG